MLTELMNTSASLDRWLWFQFRIEEVPKLGTLGRYLIIGSRLTWFYNSLVYHHDSTIIILNITLNQLEWLYYMIFWWILTPTILLASTKAQAQMLLWAKRWCLINGGDWWCFLSMMYVGWLKYTYMMYLIWEICIEFIFTCFCVPG